jgi:hypothetical protein
LTESSDVTSNNLHFRPTRTPGVAEIDQDAIDWLIEHRDDHEDGYTEPTTDDGYLMYMSGNVYPVIPINR